METIAAIATAQSPSAIGIVRLSGEETRRVLAALFTPANGMAVEARRSPRPQLHGRGERRAPLPWLAGRTVRGAASGICRGRTAGAAR